METHDHPTQLPGSVTILGGGVVGWFLAYCLVLSGMPVNVVERQRTGAGASGASAGNVQAVTGPCGALETTLGVESLKRWHQHLPAIKEESGIDIMDQEVRYLYLAMDEQEGVDLQALHADLHAQGLDTEWLDRVAVRELESRLHPDALGGMLLRGVVQMDAQRCVEALEHIVRARGGQFINREVTGLRREGRRVNGVELADGTVLPCEALVLALGGWTHAAVSRWFDLALPVQPYSLQKLHVRVLGDPLGCAVRWRGINVVTRRDGAIHVGSVHEDTGLNAEPSEAGKQELLERFKAILPGAEVEVIDALAGLAAFVPDPERVPFLGALPGVDDVYVAAPSANGFLLSATMGTMLADHIVHGRAHDLMSHMLPDRVMAT